MTDKLPLGGFNTGPQGKVPGRSRGERRGTGRAQPDGTARAVHDVANRLDDAFGQWAAATVVAQRIDEAVPFDAVVELVAEEVLVDEYAELAARASRRDHDREQDTGGGQEQDLQQGPP